MVKILIFDSGVGGLSIYQEVRRTLPAASYIYASDNEAFPYGTKSEDDVLARVGDVLNGLTSQFSPDLMVVACNTASTVALPRLRGSIAIPVVGVVPAIKPAARMSKTKVIGLLATPATVRRPYTQKLIDDFASDCRVVRVGSSELVGLAEDKLRGKALDIDLVRAIISPLFESPEASDLDTIVLGCTHFPLLRTELATAAPRLVSWVDSGQAIAHRVKSLLSARATASDPEKNPPSHWAVFTAPGPEVDSLRGALSRLGLGQVAFL